MMRKLLSLCGAAALVAATANNNCNTVTTFDGNGSPLKTETQVCNWNHVQQSGVGFDVFYSAIYLGSSSVFSRPYGDSTAVGADVAGFIHQVNPWAGVTWRDVGNGFNLLEYVAAPKP